MEVDVVRVREREWAGWYGATLIGEEGERLESEKRTAFEMEREEVEGWNLVCELVQ